MKQTYEIEVNKERFGLADVMHSFSKLQQLIKELETIKGNMHRLEENLLQWVKVPEATVKRQDVEQMLKSHFEQISFLNCQYWDSFKVQIQEELDKKAGRKDMEEELNKKLNRYNLEKTLMEYRRKQDEDFGIMETHMNYFRAHAETVLAKKVEKEELEQYATNEMLNYLNERVVALEKKASPEENVNVADPDQKPCLEIEDSDDIKEEKAVHVISRKIKSLQPVSRRKIALSLKKKRATPKIADHHQVNSTKIDRTETTMIAQQDLPSIEVPNETLQAKMPPESAGCINEKQCHTLPGSKSTVVTMGRNSPTPLKAKVPDTFKQDILKTQVAEDSYYKAIKEESIMAADFDKLKGDIEDSHKQLYELKKENKLTRERMKKLEEYYKKYDTSISEVEVLKGQMFDRILKEKELFKKVTEAQAPKGNTADYNKVKEGMQKLSRQIDDLEEKLRFAEEKDKKVSKADSMLSSITKQMEINGKICKDREAKLQIQINELLERIVEKTRSQTKEDLNLGSTLRKVLDDINQLWTVVNSLKIPVEDSLDRIRMETKSIHREFLYQQEANRSLEQTLKELLKRDTGPIAKRHESVRVSKDVPVIRNKFEFRLPRISVNTSFDASHTLSTPADKKPVPSLKEYLLKEIFPATAFTNKTTVSRSDHKKEEECPLNIVKKLQP